MSTGATSPSVGSDQYMLFNIDLRVVPILVSLLTFCVLAVIMLFVLRYLQMRQLRRIRANPELLHRQRSPPSVPIKPIMTTVSLEDHLEAGRANTRWEDIKPLAIDIRLESRERAAPPTQVTKAHPQSGIPLLSPKAGDKSRLKSKEELEVQYMQVTVLVALPSIRSSAPTGHSGNPVDLAFGISKEKTHHHQ